VVLVGGFRKAQRIVVRVGMIKNNNMSLKFESLEDNMFKNEQVDKEQMSKITGGQTGFTHYIGRNTYVMQEGDHVAGFDNSDGQSTHSVIVEGWK